MELESTDSSAGSQHPQLPPGFRFHPTDEELVVHYLKKKAASVPLPVAIITEVDLYKFDPWELPGKANFGEQEWYFFSPRDRKYPNGARPNRAATSGYWKATGTDKPILTYGGTHKVGVKKALVFYGGKPPKGIKTNWIMHEYRLVDGTGHCRTPNPGDKKSSLRLDDWVLCRIYKKNNSNSSYSSSCSNNHRPIEQNKDNSMEDDILGAAAAAQSLSRQAAMAVQQENPRPQQHQRAPANYPTALLDNEETFIDGLLANDHDGLSANNPKLNLTAVPASTVTLPDLMHSLAPSFWADPAGTISPPPAKRFHAGSGGSGGNSTTNNKNKSNGSGSNSRIAENDDGGHTMLATLLSQIPPHGADYERSTINLGSLRPNGGGGSILQQQFQLPGINWSS